ncbi:KIR protein [Plasmodium knowlesi strain H]|uniref:KIR protein n=3 Tax=Plasmodium knowlesi TaxID=5850 RepID=A0A5K1TWP3_PLAKH|nr:KIR protein [Plasmodium knowlesi strain H]OTN68122.1 KIR protein [Plasmodium knowlesi]CAA9986998.1 KIR protein [Plasmodium knowlesi strain H]SBO26653.1 KIR protein [Plasmodium knowlesi strain H]SBO28204.1 KIR protein [Plasmodium knowlesi strain H]VVS76472.1 KIR protein [Plasmodium knowlesi strain H]|eukprot:XP_002258243.1 KIR protein [Plasmodium knowlesi strain H]
MVEEAKDDPLKNLPSRVHFYSKFNSSTGECAEGYNRNVKEKILHMESGAETYADSIREAECYVSRVGRSTASSSHSYYKDRCNFLYFWIGNMLSSKLTNGVLFPTIMQLIYTELDNWYGMHECKILSTNADSNLFQEMKRIFDYYHDYGTIVGITNDGKPHCKTEYEDYVDALRTAYTNVETYCKVDTKNASDDYCKWFQEKFNNTIGTIPKPTDLKCKPNPNANQAGSSGPGAVSEHGDSGGGSGGVGGMVGGTLATVGLPTIGFFLYKYTNIFDGIKKSLFGGSNNTGGRNRGRRSIGRRQHFDDTFTENDSSTLGDDGSTTLGGGGGGESSTLGGSSTDVSTIYDDDGGRRRRPSSSPSRKPYNTHQSRNIRYGRI